ncbi:MAG: M28 family peptidase [Desulfobacterales bacterium]|nr:M28 family peptidase [Desulfobacterales bacterium]
MSTKGSRFWHLFLVLPGIVILLLGLMPLRAIAADKDRIMVDIQHTTVRLKAHLTVLTRTIGERSVYRPENLKKAEDYIRSTFRDIGLDPRSQTYQYEQMEVANIEAEVSFGDSPSKRYVVGAHYDSVAGTVGADDNASAVAVLLETARQLAALKTDHSPDIAVKFVAFALEEPPVYGTRFMGSRVYARNAKKTKEKIDGMICLEMVGYTCQQPGCQDYPFPLMYFGYPEKGNFIGIVGNVKSRRFARGLTQAFLNNPELPVVKLTVPLSGWILPSVRLSDHASFWDEGFKAVMITDSAFYRNPHYHLLSDSMETLDFNFMARLVQSLLLFFQSHR